MRNKSQLNDLCRVCMKGSSSTVSFENPLYSDKIITVLDALGVVIGQELSSSNQLPSCLCSVCFVHLQISHNLKIQFVETQRILLNKIFREDLVQDELIIKEDISTELISRLPDSCGDEIEDNNSIIMQLPEDCGNEIKEDNLIMQQVPNENDGLPMDSSEQYPSNSNQNNNESLSKRYMEDHSSSTEDASEIEELCENEPDISNIIEQHQCNSCDFQTVNIANLQRHFERTHLKVIYSCKHCNFRTIFDNELKEHLQTSHVNLTQMGLQCDFCTFSTESTGALKLHVIQVHKSTKVYKCRGCSHVAFSFNHHQLHIKKAHKAIDASLIPNPLPFQAHPQTPVIPNTPLIQAELQTQVIPHPPPAQKQYRTQVRVISITRNNAENSVETLEISSDEEDTNLEENNRCENNGVVMHNTESTSILRDLLKKRSLDDAIDHHPKKLKNGTADLYECGLCLGSRVFTSNCYLTFLRHRDLCHPGLCESKCRHCAYRTFSKKHLEKHLQDVHNVLLVEGKEEPIVTPSKCRKRLVIHKKVIK